METSRQRNVHQRVRGGVSRMNPSQLKIPPEQRIEKMEAWLCFCSVDFAGVVSRYLHGEIAERSAVLSYSEVLIREMDGNRGGTADLLARPREGSGPFCLVLYSGSAPPATFRKLPGGDDATGNAGHRRA